MNGGTCFVRSPSTYKCKCKIRFIGKHCENEDLFIDISYTMSGDDSIFPLQYQNKPQMPFPIFQPSNQLPFPRPKADKQMPSPSSQPDTQPPKKTQNINKYFPSPTLSSLRNNYPVRRNFPRTWIREEINMRFSIMNYLLEYIYNIIT